ncbi:MAG: beta-ketoacyl-[acyl-carrier-protein] synthase II, partial [Rhodothermales bacterium]|nr:beta-ketoacyl-[acyl-carrier-protein] synthase II [Rhodothermales bacterium]
MQNRARRVVVTGMGALTPIGLSVDEFWRGMMAGRSGAATITKFDTEPFASKFACELDGYDPTMDMDRKQARRLDGFCQYALSVAKQAVIDAGVDTTTLSDEERDRIAVIFGSGIGGIKVFADQVQTYLESGVRRLSPFFIPMLIPDIAAGYISIEYGFRGPNYCVVSACATGNNNIGDAFMLIQRGLADAAVCG